MSDFRLDNYEVTVGRFKNFVAAYSQNMILAGAGKNPNNPSDPGWNASWNAADMPADAAALTKIATCQGNAPWLPGKDSLPITCIGWYIAEAFCIWDGGRLPTAAEGDYAAAGGSLQWTYPWGNEDPGPLDRAIYNWYYPTGTSDISTGSIAPVGLIPAGNGKWGQSDLAGNVQEWEQDTSARYPTPCVNCATLDTSVAPQRRIRGGDYESVSSHLTSRFDIPDDPGPGSSAYGMRCAR